MSDRTQRTVLLNPGPVTLTNAVRQSLLRRDMCHREQDFSILMRDVRRRLCQIYEGTKTDWTSVLITGSGTAAVESMITSFVSGPGTSLVAANGVYGERMETMLKRAGKDPFVAQTSWQDPIDFDAVDQQLSAHPKIKHVIAVQHETTTGRLNDLGRLARLCDEHGKRMLIDAVSSFGGEEIEFDRWPIDAVAATANKCLHAVPGIAFVITKADSIASLGDGASGLYLDLGTNFVAQEKGFPAFTPAIQSLYALDQALTELDRSGGWRERNKIYRQRSALVQKRLGELGIRPLLPGKDHSSVLTAYHLPDDKTYESISRPLEEVGIVIYAGQKHLEQLIFRIAVMGDLEEADFELLFSTLGSACQ